MAALFGGISNPDQRPLSTHNHHLEFTLLAAFFGG
jgi:hypothetical protein